MSCAVPESSGILQGLKASVKARETTDSRTPTEALRSQDSKLWKKAMNEEYQAMVENDTWEIVELLLARRQSDANSCS